MLALELLLNLFLFLYVVNAISIKSINDIAKSGGGRSLSDNFQALFYERNRRLYEKAQNDIRMGKSGKVDKSLWYGMEESRNKDIIFLDSYKGAKGILELFSITNLTKLSHARAEAIYFRMVESIHVLCKDMKRYGNIGDGGWDLCVSPPFNLMDGCLVYSFGINFDFSFDDNVAKAHNCTVKSFDPSMSDRDHVRSDNVHFYQLGLGSMNIVTKDRWVIKTLSTIRRFLQHTNRTIDVLKIDIEFSEWESLTAMIRDRSLLSVKQLVFETHTHDLFRSVYSDPASGYTRLFGILQLLETETPFRKYHCHPNPDGSFISEFSGNLLTCCYELYYLNIAYLRRS